MAVVLFRIMFLFIANRKNERLLCRVLLRTGKIEDYYVDRYNYCRCMCINSHSKLIQTIVSSAPAIQVDQKTDLAALKICCSVAVPTAALFAALQELAKLYVKIRRYSNCDNDL